MTTDNKQHTTAPVQTLFDHKLDITQVWDADDHLVPLTTVQVGTSVVTQVRIEEVDGYSAVQLEFGEVPAREVTKPVTGHFAKAGVEPRRHPAEAHTSAANNYELSQELRATVFETGQAIDVSGNTKGKGFAGVIKRHDSAGVFASHGAHRNHRKPGSVGACATPGHVFEGLHMAGRMGNVRRTVQNLKIQAADAEEDLLLISGVIPDPKNGVVLVRSFVKDA